MRSHEKASTAGSIQRQAGRRLGRFLRGADPTRGSSHGASGSGAPAAGRLVLPVGVLVALVALMVAAIPAGATKTHLVKETFGSAAQPTFGDVRAIALDQSTGDVLVMDPGGTPSIERYNADGTPDNFTATGSNAIDGQGAGDETPQNGLSFANASESQIAVDNSGGPTDGNIYVTQGSPNLINIFSDEGAYLGQLTAAGATNFNEACGVAVDSSGAVYVGDYSGGIHKFVPAANPPVNADNTATFTSVTQPCAVAAGAGPTAGFLFAARYSGPISKLDSSTGELKYEVSPSNYTSVTVNPGDGRVFGSNIARAKEFDASGGSTATLVSDFSSRPDERFIEGIAVRGSTGEIYWSLYDRANLEVLGPLVVVPDVTTGAASNIEPTSATLNGAVNPDGVELSECKFEYGKTNSYGGNVPCAQSAAAIGSGSSDVSVSADISGLELGAEYHFRLVAKNVDGTSSGQDSAFKLQSSPLIVEQWATDVTYTEGAIHANVNPEGIATTYKFEWGPTAAYGESTTPANLGSDKAIHHVSTNLDDLEPGTVYHYRIVATNSVGTREGADRTFATYVDTAPDTSCANQAFRVGPSAKLPDCRAYEMVSPVEKGGEGIRQFEGLRGLAGYNQAAVDGNKLTYTSSTAFGDQKSARNASQYIATRTSDGWTTHGINPPSGRTLSEPGISLTGDFETPFKLFTPDLSAAWVADNRVTPITSDAAEGWPNLYKRDNLTDGYQALTTQVFATTPEPPIEEFFEVLGHSSDFSHLVFNARNQRLTADSSSAERQLYMYADGDLRLVSVLPDGTASPVSSWAGSQRGSLEHEAWLSHAVSDDGSRVVWTEAIQGGNGPQGRLHLRLNADQPPSVINGAEECTEPSKACTIPVSSDVAQFWTARADGSAVIYSEGPLANGDGHLFEFDVDTQTSSEIAGGLSGVLGASDDASHIYFTSTEALDGGAVAGAVNLYLSRNGTISFIAVLSPFETNMGNDDRGTPTVDSIQSRYHSSRVTPDGLHVAFQSARSLTGYDNTDAVTGQSALEVYIYDAVSDELTCASCRPSGARPTGRVLPEPYSYRIVPTELWSAAWIPTFSHNLFAARVLSDDGERLYFNSFDALLPQDTNGEQDVYQWEADGAGTCEKAGGCLSLMSTGRSPVKSEFVDASPDGRDVFIETDSSIAPLDLALTDIYDVREGGGYPPPPPPPVPCVGDSCQSVPAAPNDATPASASFKGPGDPTSRADCSTSAKRAAGLRREAKQARLRGQRGYSARLVRKSKDLSKKASRCRRANRGTGR